MIKCDTDIICTLKSARNNVNEKIEKRKFAKLITTAAVVGGGMINVGSLVAAPFTFGATLAGLEFGVPLQVGGYAANTALNIMLLLRDNGDIGRIKRCAEQHDNIAKELKVVTENMCLILNKLMTVNNFQERNNEDAIIAYCIYGALDIVNVVLTANIAHEAAHDLNGLIISGGLQWQHYLSMLSCAVVAFASSRLSSHENEAIRSMSALLGFSTSQVDRITDVGLRMQVLFGIGAGNMYFSVVNKVDRFINFVGSQHNGIKVIDEFIEILETEINTLEGLKRSNNN